MSLNRFVLLTSKHYTMTIYKFPELIIYRHPNRLNKNIENVSISQISSVLLSCHRCPPPSPTQYHTIAYKVWCIKTEIYYTTTTRQQRDEFLTRYIFIFSMAQCAFDSFALRFSTYIHTNSNATENCLLSPRRRKKKEKQNKKNVLFL